VTYRDEWEAMSKEERRAFADPKRKCIEKGCDEPAGTPWGQYWCADHDDARIKRITAGLRGIQATLCKGCAPCCRGLANKRIRETTRRAGRALGWQFDPDEGDLGE